jgi:hypothetical protein
VSTPSPVRLLLSAILNNSAPVWKIEGLLDEIGWPDNEETREKLPSIMGRVARKLCFEHNKVLLHGKGEYWLARRAKRDRALAEQWMSRALRSIENKSNRWRVVAGGNSRALLR